MGPVVTAFSPIAAREGSCPIWETSLQWETPFSDHHFLFKIKAPHPFSIKESFYHGHFHKSCENCIENSVFKHSHVELLNLCRQVLVSGLGRKATLLSEIAHDVTYGCFPLTELCAITSVSSLAVWCRTWGCVHQRLCVCTAEGILRDSKQFNRSAIRLGKLESLSALAECR